MADIGVRFWTTKSIAKDKQIFTSRTMFMKYTLLNNVNIGEREDKPITESLTPIFLKPLHFTMKCFLRRKSVVSLLEGRDLSSSPTFNSSE